ncbi:MAG: hypothetical protein E7540_00005 [Ruminococcaceae bacterium]|nr:hypothetical protein [Oscillospiraceae bacterium]
MKKIICLLLLIVLCFSGCSAITITPPPESEPQSSSEPDEVVLITYESAFDYVKSCEDNIIEALLYTLNASNESAAEIIINSNEYKSLYCSYWKALEILQGKNDPRFEKSKMRWKEDLNNEEWSKLLADALEKDGVSAFQNEYFRLYSDEVFPKAEARWQKGPEEQKDNG